jgi:MbtH protein
MNDMLVVLNDEEQYSIWSADRPIPAGWRPEGFTGTREACLAHIDAAWTDMRPRSVREAMRTRSQE